MSPCRNINPISLGVGAIFALVATEAEGKICLIHEQVIEHRTSLQDLAYKGNLTIVKIHSCPVFTQCCEVSGGCCLDYPWLWSTLIVCILLMAVTVTAFYWYKKKRAAIHANWLPTGHADTEYPLVVGPLCGPRSARDWRISSGSPMPPAYNHELHAKTSSAVPGVYANSQGTPDPPPPYAAPPAGRKPPSVTQTTMV